MINNGTILRRVRALAANPKLQYKDHLGKNIMKFLKGFEQLLCLAEVVYLGVHVGHMFKMILN